MDKDIPLHVYIHILEIFLYQRYKVLMPCSKNSRFYYLWIRILYFTMSNPNTTTARFGFRKIKANLCQNILILTRELYIIAVRNPWHVNPKFELDDER